jgi:exodeoxyribonuclease-3
LRVSCMEINMTLKLQSWNVNGLRAVIGKNFPQYLAGNSSDYICLQEIKTMPDQIDFDFSPYTAYWHSADRKGYAGTLTLVKDKPLSVSRRLGADEFDKEGRVLTLEYPEFYLVNVYSPNSKRELLRLKERMYYEDLFREYLLTLKEKKSVIVCGDLNVANKEIDLKNPAANRKTAGFTDEEREKFGQLLDSGFIDSFRHFYPDMEEAYTWWSYITRARERNAGWRIDFFLVSDCLKNNLVSASIHADVMGSDHCPVELEIKI